VVHHAFGRGRRARRKTEHAEIVRPVGDFGRVIGVAEFVQRLEQTAIRGVLASRITIAETASAIIGRAIRGGVEIFVPQHEIGRDAVQHFAHVGRIDLHIDGAERGTVALDRVI
jgi:hypothetical protein